MGTYVVMMISDIRNVLNVNLDRNINAGTPLLVVYMLLVVRYIAITPKLSLTMSDMN